MLHQLLNSIANKKFMALCWLFAGEWLSTRDLKVRGGLVLPAPLGLLHGCGGLRLRRTSLFLPFHLVASVLTKSLVQSQGQGLV